jgi:hypothetical protein
VTNTKREVIALLLGESADGWHPRQLWRGAQRLVRSADGGMKLEAVETAEELERTAESTGCFRRGKPITDPYTREVIGYEMEETALLRKPAVA